DGSGTNLYVALLIRLPCPHEVCPSEPQYREKEKDGTTVVDGLLQQFRSNIGARPRSKHQLESYKQQEQHRGLEVAVIWLLACTLLFP
ncbi:hypothetical protein NDU88_004739, partial [Pleurodeles waltl]